MLEPERVCLRKCARASLLLQACKLFRANALRKLLCASFSVQVALRKRSVQVSRWMGSLKVALRKDSAQVALRKCSVPVASRKWCAQASCCAQVYTYLCMSLIMHLLTSASTKFSNSRLHIDHADRRRRSRCNAHDKGGRGIGAAGAATSAGATAGTSGSTPPVLPANRDPDKEHPSVQTDASWARAVQVRPKPHVVPPRYPRAQGWLFDL